MSEISDADGSIDRLLDDHGRMNFAQDCAESGRPARITMNESEVFVAVAGAADAVHARFAVVTSTGAGEARRVVLGDATFDVLFDDDIAAGRFDRVLGVRQDGPGVIRVDPVPDELISIRQAGPSAVGRYADWARYAMWSGALLVVVGWVALVLGVVAGVVLLAKDGAVGLVVIASSVVGALSPLCLGSLARAVVLRHQVEDERRSAVRG